MIAQTLGAFAPVSNNGLWQGCIGRSFWSVRYSPGILQMKSFFLKEQYGHKLSEHLVMVSQEFGCSEAYDTLLQ